MIEPWVYVSVYVLGAFVTMIGCHFLNQRQHVDALDVFAAAAIWPLWAFLAVVIGAVALPFMAMNWLAKRIARRLA